jgi:putative MFS transporter
MTRGQCGSLRLHCEGLSPSTPCRSPGAHWLSFSFHAYQAELYPTRIRAQAVGFVYSWSRFSAIFTGYLIAFLLREYGTTGVFTFIAAAMLIVFAVIGGFGPRTSRMRLEAISA